MSEKKKIFITHCSAKKDDTLRSSGKKVTADKLYTAKNLQRFIDKCKTTGVDWAIFSDKYGVVFPLDEIEWHSKNPSKVTPDELKLLVDDFFQKLSKYSEIWFYCNPGRFHPLYEKLIQETKDKGLNIRLLTHLSEIR